MTMNKALQEFARQELINGLTQCTATQVLLFKRMYAFKHLDWSIEKVVNAMPEDKLDWAMKQVSQTLKAAAMAVESEGGK